MASRRASASASRKAPWPTDSRRPPAAGGTARRVAVIDRRAGGATTDRGDERPATGGRPPDRPRSSGSHAPPSHAARRHRGRPRLPRRRRRNRTVTARDGDARTRAVDGRTVERARRERPVAPRRSGTGVATVEGERHDLRPGSLVPIEPGETHETRTVGSEPPVTVTVYAPPEYRDRSRPSGSAPAPRPSSRWSSRGPSVLAARFVPKVTTRDPLVSSPGNVPSVRSAGNGPDRSTWECLALPGDGAPRTGRRVLSAGARPRPRPRPRARRVAGRPRSARGGDADGSGIPQRTGTPETPPVTERTAVPGTTGRVRTRPSHSPALVSELLAGGAVTCSR